MKRQITTQIPAPKAPTALALTVAGTTQINLKWNNNTDNETGFDIERSTNGTTFSALASVAANTTTYNNIGLTPNTTLETFLSSSPKGLSVFSKIPTESLLKDKKI